MGVQVIPELSGELKSEIIRGDNAARSLFVKTWTPLIRPLIKLRFRLKPEDVDDCLQKIFIKVFKGLHKLEDNSKIKSWLCTLAIREVLNHLRGIRTRKEDPIEREWSREEPSTHETPESILINTEESQMAIEFVYGCLPRKQREAIILRLFNEKSFAEIAELMGCPYDTAKANYRHGILKLREYLDPESFLLDDQEGLSEPRPLRVQ